MPPRAGMEFRDHDSTKSTESDYLGRYVHGSTWISMNGSERMGGNSSFRSFHLAKFDLECWKGEYGCSFH